VLEVGVSPDIFEEYEAKKELRKIFSVPVELRFYKGKLCFEAKINGKTYLINIIEEIGDANIRRN